MPTISADGHYYVDLGYEPDFTPGSFTSVYPEDCSFDHQIRGVGNIDFQLSYSALDQDGNPSVSGKDFIGPMRSYWRLRYGDISIIAGVITSTSTTLGTDFMSITGKTWEHFMERWQYPYDPRFNERTPGDPRSAPCYDYAFSNVFQGNELTASGGTTPDGHAYVGTNRDLIRILSDIFSQTMNLSGRLIFDITSLSNLSGVTTPVYYLTLGDMSYLDSIINSLAETGDGFDWWISWDMKFKWASPYRFGETGAPSILYSFDTSDDTDGFLVALTFTNNGIRATHVTGFGSGLANQTRFGRAYGYPAAYTVRPDGSRFTRVDADYDFGDVRNGSQMTLKTQKQLSLDLNPQRDVPLSVNPGLYGAGTREFWSEWRVGRAISVTYDVGYHDVDSDWRIKSFSGNINREGENNLDLTLEQIFDTASNAGTIEG